MHNFSPFFGLNLQKYMISGGRKGAALLFLKECVFRGNHKCTISVSFLSKFSLRKFCILRAKYA